MSPEPNDVDVAVALVAATLGGAAIGVERQWSGHASGPHARFAGVRTFTLLGGVGGIAGLLWRRGDVLPAAVLLASATALIVAAYVAASRRSIDATTEVAALVVVAAGHLAGQGTLALSAGIVAITGLLLVEKSRLHRLVRRIDDAELRAAARFAVMAVVILPLVPEGPFGPWGGIRPRALWSLVLLFSGLTFAGWLARRVVGERRGYPILGGIGGLVSSTSVALTFARRSRTVPGHSPQLATGIVAASVVMLARMQVATALLEPSLAWASVRYLLPALAAGAAVLATFVLRLPAAAPAHTGPPRNPLELRQALQLAVLFQVVMYAVRGIEAAWGHVGILASGALLGAADVDALTVAMAGRVHEGTNTATAARALATGALANTTLKAGAVLLLGAPGLRWVATVGLGAIGGVLAAGLLL